MWFLHINGTSLNAKSGIEGLGSFQSVLVHDVVNWDSFPQQVTHFVKLRFTPSETEQPYCKEQEKEAQKD